jgi:hypothetical protein
MLMAVGGGSPYPSPADVGLTVARATRWATIDEKNVENSSLRPVENRPFRTLTVGGT